MKTYLAGKSIPIFVVVLAITLFGCSIGAPSAGGGALAGSPSATAEAHATEVPTATQPPPTLVAKPAHGTPTEAQAMLKLAVAHYQAVGRTQALADFNAGMPPFKDRDLYVACLDANHTTLANGGFPNLVGTPIDSLLTTSGVPLGKATWAVASTSAVNSVNYHWVNPASGKTEARTFYFQKVDAKVVCGVGAYNP